MVTRDNREKDQLNNTIHLFRHLYRVQKHLEFTSTCLAEKLVPKFCQISYSMIQQNKLTVADIKKLQSRKLLSAQSENEEKYQKYNFEYEKNFKLLYLISPNIPYYNNLIHSLKNSVFRSEKYLDKNRDLKLANLKRKTFYPTNKAKIIMKLEFVCHQK